MRALTKSAQNFALIYGMLNSHDNNHLEIVQMHKVKLRPQGEYNMYSPEDWSELTLAGSIESNANADPDSPYITMRTVPA
jgi:hypothetical protein